MGARESEGAEGREKRVVRRLAPDDQQDGTHHSEEGDHTPPCSPLPVRHEHRGGERRERDEGPPDRDSGRAVEGDIPVGVASLADPVLSEDGVGAARDQEQDHQRAQQAPGKREWSAMRGVGRFRGGRGVGVWRCADGHDPESLARPDP